MTTTEFLNLKFGDKVWVGTREFVVLKTSIVGQSSQNPVKNKPIVLGASNGEVYGASLDEVSLTRPKIKVTKTETGYGWYDPDDGYIRGMWMTQEDRDNMVYRSDYDYYVKATITVKYETEE